MSIMACQSAAAMAAQMLSNRSAWEISKAWGRGVSELYLEIAHFGQWSASLSSEFEQEGSGVYSYDVDEEFGDYLALEILKDSYDFETAKAKLQELITTFYCGEQPEMLS